MPIKPYTAPSEGLEPPSLLQPTVFKTARLPIITTRQIKQAVQRFELVALVLETSMLPLTPTAYKRNSKTKTYILHMMNILFHFLQRRMFFLIINGHSQIRTDTV